MWALLVFIAGWSSNINLSIPAPSNRPCLLFLFNLYPCTFLLESLYFIFSIFSFFIYALSTHKTFLPSPHTKRKEKNKQTPSLPQVILMMTIRIKKEPKEGRQWRDDGKNTRKWDNARQILHWAIGLVLIAFIVLFLHFRTSEAVNSLISLIFFDFFEF